MKISKYYLKGYRTRIGFFANIHSLAKLIKCGVMSIVCSVFVILLMHFESEVVCFFKVSSIRASKSDDKRLSIFTGTKTLHLRCVSREDRAVWIEALLASKDLFPRVLTSSDFGPSEDVVVSTEKLKLRLQQEGIGEAVIKDCESIMLLETSELKIQLRTLRHKHVLLLETLRQLEVFICLSFIYPYWYTLLLVLRCCSVCLILV